MISYIEAIRNESARFAEATRLLPPGGPVPSCPDWTVADLIWHLAEVQGFWASIVEGPLLDPELVERTDRPADADLPQFFTQQSSRLQAALTSHHPDKECWSWHHSGHSVGWVLRRQAHEALIHRADAELASGDEIIIDTALAADGVDEALAVIISSEGLPQWARFEPDGSTALLQATDVDRRWAVSLGRLHGTSPNSGETFDDPAIKLIPAAQHPASRIRGTSPDLDLWLWGRGPLDRLTLEGDVDIAHRIRAAAVAGTQ